MDFEVCKLMLDCGMNKGTMTRAIALFQRCQAQALLGEGEDTFTLESYQHARRISLQLRFHFSMEKWWKNKGKVSGPWKNKALFLPFSRIWKQRSFFLCSSTVFPWKNRNPVAVFGGSL